jgi:hypothetical protein
LPNAIESNLCGFRTVENQEKNRCIQHSGYFDKSFPEKSFGYKNDEIIGRNFDLLYAEVDKLKTRSEQNEILAGRISQWEAKLITKEDKIEKR